MMLKVDVVDIDYDTWLGAFNRWRSIDPNASSTNFAAFLGISIYDTWWKDHECKIVSVPSKALPMIKILTSPHYLTLLKVRDILLKDSS